MGFLRGIASFSPYARDTRIRSFLAQSKNSLTAIKSAEFGVVTNSMVRTV